MTPTDYYYEGSFMSREGHEIKVVIYKYDTTTSGSDYRGTIKRTLEFPAKDPVTVEWDSDGKRDAVVGSTATVTIISPGDRTYLDLYTTEPGYVTLYLFRDGVLWWRGALDTEFYEEPYSTEKNYDVTLTFSDFGIFERLKYTLEGTQSYDNIVKDALYRSASVEMIYLSYVLQMATTIGTQKTDLSSFFIRSDNFKDEDGNTLSLKEVLEGILTPLNLSMRQWGGQIFVRDMHSASQLEPEDIEWTAADAVLGTDEVANNVTITFSPYAESSVMGNDYYKYTGKYSLGDFSNAGTQKFLTIAGGKTTDGGRTFAFYPDYGDRSSGSSAYDYQNLSFGVISPIKGDMDFCKGLEYIGPYVSPGKIFPLLSASEKDVIIQGFATSGHTKSTSNQRNWIGTNNGAYKAGLKNANIDSAILFRVAQQEVFPDSGNKTRLKIVVPLLYDVRYNYETSPSGDNESGNYNYMHKRVSTIFIPVRVYVRDTNGKILCHYRNLNRCSGSTVDYYCNQDTYSTNSDGWVKGAPSGKTANNWEMWLCYYTEEDDRAENGGVWGWNNNHHAIGYKASGTLPESYKKRFDGEIIPLPPYGGQLVIEVYMGVYVYDYAVNLEWGKDSSISSSWLSSNIRWHMYQPPRVSVVNNDLKFSDLDTEDIEYSGTLLESAKDDISIDTICGTSVNVVPGARGVMLNADGKQITELTRAGRTDTAEQLLIGTLYSQYASRHIVLRGTHRLPKKLDTFTDKNIDGKKFVVTETTVNLIADECESTFIEISPDIYIKK